MKGLIPCAGLGTRLGLLSVAVPKELLPLGLRPAVHYHMEDLAAGGISQVVVVVNRQKEALVRYLEAAFPEAEFTFVYQNRPQGLGIAILEARKALEDEPFVMLLPDNIFIGPQPLTAALTGEFAGTCCSCATLFPDAKPKPKPGANFAMETVEMPNGSHLVVGLHPKERFPSMTSMHFGPAAYLFTSEVFEPLEFFARHWDFASGDYHERLALDALIRGKRLVATWVRGSCFDIGTPQGYLDCLRFVLGSG